MTSAADVRLQRGIRVIRQMAGDAESPWPGALICLPSGETAVAVDSDVLGDGWRGWSAAPAGHVLAPVDIVRRSDGHDVLLPVCAERLADFLDRRGGLDLSAGEGVTLAVSLLRGVAELSTDAGARGTWWLTDAGRPVFATDTSSSGVHDVTADLLRRIALDVPALAEVLTGAVEALADGRRGRVLERAEAALFAVAEPTALATTTFGPKRVRDRSVLESDPLGVGSPPERGPWPLALFRHLDAEWADVVSRATTGVWRAVRTPRPGRRRPWLVAGGLACVIIVGGLLWPTGRTGTATAEPSTPSPAASSEPSPTHTDAPPDAEDAVGDVGGAGASAAEGAPPDLVSVTGALLTARAACEAEPSCLAGVLETPSSEFPPGVADFTEAERSVALLDEFGGAAVLRVEPVGRAGAPQLVVVVQIDGRWLLRDVYDIAEQ